MNNQEKVKLLRATQKLLLELHTQFSPYETSIPQADSDERGCICCFLCKAAGFERLTPDAVFDEAKARLRDEPVDELFTTDEWPAGLEAKYNSFTEGSFEAAKVGCEVIDAFIKTYYSDVQEN